LPYFHFLGRFPTRAGRQSPLRREAIISPGLVPRGGGGQTGASPNLADQLPPHAAKTVPGYGEKKTTETQGV